METIELMERAEELAHMMIDSALGEEYRQALQCMKQDKEAQEIIYHFVKKKEEYEEVQRFGKYHPDYKTVRKQMRECKLNLDMNDVIIRYKKAEDTIQKVLDEISVIIGGSVSSSIKVPTGNPYFDTQGCSGGCGSGGSCGCKAG